MATLSFSPFWGIPGILNQFFNMDLKGISSKSFLDLVDSRLKATMPMSFSFDKTITLEAPLNDGLLEYIHLIKSVFPRAYIVLKTPLTPRQDVLYFKSLLKNGVREIHLCRTTFAKDTSFGNEGNYGDFLANVVILSTLAYTVRTQKVTLLQPYYTNDVPHPKFWRHYQTFLNFYYQLGFVKVETAFYPPGEVKRPWEIPIPCNVVYGTKAGSFVVGENLDVYPCKFHMGRGICLGNLQNQSIWEIFNGEPAQSFRRAWWKLEQASLPVCCNCADYSTNTSNPEETDRIVAWMGQRLHGKDVLFWGAGQAYRQFGAFFVGSQPLAMIIDGVATSQEIDGMPVKHASIIQEADYSGLPIVIFAHPYGSRIILNKIRSLSGLALKNIYICPPNYL